MTQSALHVALIMDGNGRWATARGLPRAAGHRAGVETVRRVVEAAPHLGIGVVTLYAFSADNWSRPPEEVAILMALLRGYLRRETAKARQEGVRITFIGRRDRLAAEVATAIETTERVTAAGTKLHVRIAVDYSSRDAILAAAQAAAAENNVTRENLERHLASPAVDLLIRTSGEQRLSDYLLWECAYAEFHFTRVHWPDFGEPQLAQAVTDFRGRDRRFGGLTRAS